MSAFNKYPRTRHVQGSGFQHGEDGSDAVPFGVLAGRHLVVEEKMDGANCALSFDACGGLLLQSRGHYLVGGEREKQFDLFKAWARAHCAQLWELLRDSHIVYGEWLYAKHTIYYSELPHYFLEFDVLEKRSGHFLSTVRRRALLARVTFVSSVRVLYEGELKTVQQLAAMLDRSAFIGVDSLDRLRAECDRRGLDIAQVLRQTDASPLMEGLYVKVEEGGIVQERYKYVRAGFLQTVVDSESHWADRPLLPNGLRPGASLF